MRWGSIPLPALRTLRRAASPAWRSSPIICGACPSASCRSCSTSGGPAQFPAARQAVSAAQPALHAGLHGVHGLGLAGRRHAVWGKPPARGAVFGRLPGGGMALFYMRGSSSGGADFLIVSVKTLRPHLSIGAVGLLLDLVVILLGWPVFGDVDAVLYGVLSTAVSSIVIDKILYGMDAGKLLVIITTKGRQVASRIAAESGRGSTMLRAAGSYTGTARQVLLCACSKSQAFRVRACVYEVDAAAFVMIAETSEVYGEGFRPAGG